MSNEVIYEKIIRLQEQLINYYETGNPTFYSEVQIEITDRVEELKRQLKDND